MKPKHIIIIIILISISFFSCDLISDRMVNVLTLLVIFYLVLEYMKYKDASVKKTAMFSKPVLMLMLFPFLSSITCYIYRGQPIINSLIVNREMLLWVFYFFLHWKRVNPQYLINCVCGIGICFALINIIQQITYPSFAYFGVVTNEFGILEERNGFYRFRISGSEYVFFLTFYSFYLLLARKSVKSLIFFILGIAGIYLTLTRQLWVAAIISLLLIPLLLSNIQTSKKILFTIFGSMACILIINNLDTIFGRDLLEQSSNQFYNSDYVRWRAYEFYGLDYWVDWFNMLLGNGMHAEVAGNQYGAYIRKIYDDFGLFQSDIGIVGVFSQYGLIYVLAIVLFYRKLFILRTYVQPYILMLICASLVTIFMIFWVRDAVFFSIILYMVDVNIEYMKSGNYQTMKSANIKTSF